MAAFAQIKRSLRHWIRPELDANRAVQTHQRFDEACHYAEYHAACRGISPVENPPRDASDELSERGFEVVPVMTSSEAERLRGEVERRATRETFRNNADMVERFRLDDAELESELLEHSLTPAIEQRIRAFFGCEFLVHWSAVTRALPVREETRNSFLWHCDKGPTSHLKLLVYLNDTREHGGNTIFVDLETTRRMAETGYLFGKVEDRREDLDALAKSAGIDFQPQQSEIAAGEGLLFQPSCVLHRGLLPQRSERYIIALCLLPSPVTWREARARGATSDLATDEKWHEDARELLSQLA